MFLLSRYRYGHLRPLSGRASKFNRAAVRRDDTAGDTQSEPGSRSVAGLIDTVETVEHAGDMFRGNAHAVVAHTHAHATVFLVGGNLNGAAVGGVLDGIVHKVKEHLGQQRSEE